MVTLRMCQGYIDTTTRVKHLCVMWERARKRERERDGAVKGGVSLGFEWREDEGGKEREKGVKEGKRER